MKMYKVSRYVCDRLLGKQANKMKKVIAELKDEDI